MNELIEKLAEKAGFSVYGEIYSPNDEDSPITKNIEKFAELIVLECSEIQNKRSCERHGYDKHEDAKAIKQHFGVEE